MQYPRESSILKTKKVITLIVLVFIVLFLIFVSLLVQKNKIINLVKHAEKTRIVDAMELDVQVKKQQMKIESVY